MPSLDALAFIKDPLLGGLAAFAVAAGFLLLGGVLGRRRPGTPRPWIGALALGGGYLAGQAAALGWPWPPREALQRLLYVVLGTTVVGALILPRVRGGAGAWVLRLVLLLAAWAYVIPPAAWSAWSGPEKAAWLLGLGLAGTAFWYVLDRVAGQQLGPFPPLFLLGIALCTALVLVRSRSAVLGQLAGLLLAALVPFLARGWSTSAPALGPGAVAVLAMLLPGLWLVDYFTATEPSALCLLLLAGAPVLAWCFPVPAASRGWSVARAVISMAPIGVAAGLAVPELLPEKDEAGGYSMPLPSASGPARAPSEASSPPPAPPGDDDNPFRFTEPTSDK